MDKTLLAELCKPASEEVWQPDPAPLAAGIPAQSIIIMAGETNTGKTTYIDSGIVAPLSVGKPTLWATTETGTKPLKTLLISVENTGYKHTEIIERAGGDCSQVVIFDAKKANKMLAAGSPLRLMSHDLDELIMKIEPDLIVLDPVLLLCDSAVDPNNNRHVLPLLRRLRQLTESYNVSVIVVLHTRKSGGGSAIQAIAGASAWSNYSDTIFFMQKVDEDGDDESHLALTCDKWRGSDKPSTLVLQRSGTTYTVEARNGLGAGAFLTRKQLDREGGLAEARSTRTKANRQAAAAAIIKALTDQGAYSEATAAKRRDFETAMVESDDIKVGQSTLRAIIDDLAIAGRLGTARGKVWLIEGGDHNA